MKTENILISDLPQPLKYYIYSLKTEGKNELYENLVMMLFYKGAVGIIEDRINNLTNQIDNQNGPTVNFNIESSKEYEDMVDSICKSKYFVENFDKADIDRRNFIMKNIIAEMLMQIGANHVVNSKIKQKNPVILNYQSLQLPAISHSFFTEKKVSKTKLVFSNGTPLNEIITYLKDVLEIENNPKRKKMSLGEGFRMLQIEQKVKPNRQKILGQTSGYLDDLIKDEMNNKYKDNLTREGVSKTLQRVRSLKKDINIRWTNKS